MIKRNAELDRLRAFAVIMTVMIHYARVFFPWAISREYQHGTTILNIWLNSWTGVDLFFVISGYIISTTLVQQIDYLKQSQASLVPVIKGFFLRRIYRIYPVAWLVFVFVLACAFLFNESGNFGTPENTIEAGISIFTYTFNYYFADGSYHVFTLSPYWSLSVEEQFYLILPFFLIFTQNTKQRVNILIAILLLITFYIRPHATVDSLFLTETRCDGLIYGCLIYFLSQQPWFSTLISYHPGKKYIRIWLTIALILVLSAITALGFSNNLVIPLACILSSLLVAIAALQKNIIISFPVIQECLDYLGSRSYSLYLVHFPMFSLTQEVMHRLSIIYRFNIDSHLAAYYTIMAAILTGVSTEALYRYIEVPFMRIGKKLSASANERITSQNQQVSLSITINKRMSYANHEC